MPVNEMLETESFYIWELVDKVNFNLSYTDTEETTTIFSGSDLCTEIQARYGNYLYDCYSTTNIPTLAQKMTQAKLEFKTTFQAWASAVAHDYAMAFRALKEKYSPLENYYREELGEETDAKHYGHTETTTITEEGSDTLEKHKGTKTSVSAEEVSTPRSKTKETGYKVAFDDSSETKTSAIVREGTEGTDTIAKDPTKNYTQIEDIDGSTYDKDVRTFTDRTTTDTKTFEDISASVYDKEVHGFNGRITRGNIGVTSSQDMLGQELEVRLHNYKAQAMRDFIMMYCYSVRGVE